MLLTILVLTEPPCHSENDQGIVGLDTKCLCDEGNDHGRKELEIHKSIKLAL
jgi:hypothetical protein